MRCWECPNQAFLSVSDRVILDHLQGRHVAGVYPLLMDETCWFLAADFDKGDWMEDTAAFREACRSAGVPVAVERSRSGNGAHAWFFFDAPVPAATARRMGCFLLTQAMSRRHDLGMSSYDRLFPNQDTMPAGGVGNLIRGGSGVEVVFQPRECEFHALLPVKFFNIISQKGFSRNAPRVKARLMGRHGKNHA